MRYFFASFSHSSGFGDLTIILEEFPSKEGLIKSIEEHNPEAKEISILSLFEFKSKEDYDSFNSLND